MDSMQNFRCASCDQLLFFESTACIRCGHLVGFSARDYELKTLKPEDEAGVFSVVHQRSREESTVRYRHCANLERYNACNWLVTTEEGNELCLSCRLTDLLPPLHDERRRAQWVRVEAAKRRLLYTLLGLGLPLQSREENPTLGLAFRFQESTKAEPVLTGHASGIITMNMSEANAAFRENAKEKLGEGYRTVLGHLRHECGHYFWELLVLPSETWLPRVRELFGDDRLDYQEAVAAHYEQGAPANWQSEHISAYATMHPWEDWAETWAHYLHMVDTLETAESYGLALKSPATIGTTSQAQPARRQQHSFEALFDHWYALTFALNSLSRSMGVPDPYPFAISESAKEKLRLIHDFLIDVDREGQSGVHA